MNAKRFIPFIKIILLCVLAAGANLFLNSICLYYFKIPVFLDTVFTAAVSFAAGIIPGIVTALLTNAGLSARFGGFNPFVICSIAEVLLVCRLKPQGIAEKNTGLFDTGITQWVRIFAGLLLLYIAAFVTISVLGGIIDFLYHGVFANAKLYFSAEDAVKMSLSRSSLPVLAEDILSRIPVNIVDRFVVIFGGFFISRLLKRLV